MIFDFIQKIAPQESDPTMLRITDGYLQGLVYIFIIFSALILFPVLKRWIQVLSYRIFVKRLLKSKEPSEIRQKIQAELFKYAAWAKGGFDEYRLAWAEARPQGEEKAVIPIRLRDFLTPEVVLDSGRNRRIAEALPGIFVALGIFGTFLGLVLGLKELKLDQLETLKDSLTHLMSGLSLAFLTSLGGIALSVLFSISYRLLTHRLERALMALDRLLCRVFPFDSQERFARKYYELQSDIKQGLQTLATDVATQITGTIAPKLGEALEKHLVPVLESLQERIQLQLGESHKQQGKLIENMSEHVTRLSKVITENFHDSQKHQAEAMEAVLQHYSEAITKNFASQFENMAKVIEDTTQSQLEIKQQLINFTKQLESQFDAQNALIEKTSRAGEILGQSLESLESIAQKLKNSAEDITNAAKMLEESAISAKEGQDYLRETMQRQVESMRSTREELEKTWEKVTENAKDMISRIRETIDELSKGISDNMLKALDTFDGKVAEVVERFSGSLFEAGQTIQELPVLMAKMDQNLSAISKDLGIQKDLVADLKDTTKTVVSDNIQTAIEASKRLSENIVNIASTSSDLRNLMVNLSEIFEKNVLNYKHVNEKSLSELSQMVKELTAEIRQGASMISKEGIGKRDDNDLKKINAAIYNRIGAVKEQLTDVASGLTNKMQLQNDKMETAVNKMTDTLETIKTTTETNANNRGGWFKRGVKK